MTRKYSLRTSAEIFKQLEFALALARDGKREDMPKVKAISSICKHAAQVHAIDLMKDQFKLQEKRFIQLPKLID